MKILRLDLLAFGHFSGVTLDLSGGEHGVQLIYGPNEAGKSTALRALRGLFYGIERSSPDDFLHKYDRMRLGAVVRHSDGTVLDFVRRKGARGTFLDREEKPLDETPLQRWLAAVNEQQFVTLFGIDHQRLIEGGQRILSGGGDIGESLFEAGLGGASLHGVLQRLEEEASALFKARGQNQTINEACAEYAEAKKRIAEKSLPSQEYEQREAALARARVEREAVVEELRQLRADTQRLERLGRARPLVPLRRTLLAELEAIGAVTILPDGFGEERLGATRALEHARERESRATATLAQVAEQIGGLNIPEALLLGAATVQELQLRLGERRQAAHDLPELQAKLRAEQRQAESLLAELQIGHACPGAAAPRWSRVQQRHVRDLGQQEKVLLEQVRTAHGVKKKLERELQSACENLLQCGPVMERLRLTAAIQSAQQEGDLEPAWARAREALAAAEATTSRELRRLNLWHGTLADLENLPVASIETVERFEKQWLAAEGALSQLAAKLAETRAEAARNERALKTLLAAGDVPSEADLAEARASRDAGWQLIRRLWLEKAALDEAARAFACELPPDRAYQARVEQADDLADRLRREADRVAKRAQLAGTQEFQAAQIGALTGEIQAHESALAALQTEWAAQWPGLKPLPPREMRAWLQKHARILEHAATQRDLASAGTRIEARIGHHLGVLREALAALGERDHESSLGSLLARARSVGERLEEAARQREACQREIAKLSTRSDSAAADHASAEQALEAWRAQWQAAMRELGFAEASTPAAAEEYMASCAELLTRAETADALRERIAAIEKSAADFARHAADACREWAPELLERRPEEAVAELQARLAHAKEDAALLRELTKQRALAARELEEARQAIVHAEARLAALCQLAGGAAVEWLEELERKSNAVKVRRQKLAELEERLLAESAGAGLEELLAELEAIDPDALEGRIAENRRLIELCEEQRTVFEKQVGSEETLLVAMDGNARAAEAAEQAQQILARIEEHAERYIRLRFGAAILRREIERYRAENQDPLLRRAGEFFRELTLGSFVRATTHYEDSDRPILKGVRASGDLVPVEGMSEGTRDQLYLALQLASVEKFIASTEPMPFVVDDILIGFDHEREAAVLRTLAELSRKTQVIIFTHHAHLVEVARRTLSADVLHVHELPRRGVASASQAVPVAPIRIVD
jgi:uncharacterized protein YhaN